MTLTYWKWRLYYFVRKVDVTSELKTAIAEAFSNNGSNSTVEDEEKAFDDPVKYSPSGSLPATVHCLISPVKKRMRDALEPIILGIPTSRYVVVANTNFNSFQDNELIKTNFDITPSGQIATPSVIDSYLFNEYGLRRIQEE